MSVYDTAGRPMVAYNPTTRTVLKGATWSSQVPLVAETEDVYVYCPQACTITAVQLLTAGGPGSCEIDVRAAAFASFPPNSGDSIVASDPPAITSGTDYQDDTLSGWTTTVAAGTVLAFHLTSTSTFTNISVQLTVQQ